MRKYPVKESHFSVPRSSRYFGTNKQIDILLHYYKDGFLKVHVKICSINGHNFDNYVCFFFQGSLTRMAPRLHPQVILDPSTHPTLPHIW